MFFAFEFVHVFLKKYQIIFGNLTSDFYFWFYFFFIKLSFEFIFSVRAMPNETEFFVVAGRKREMYPLPDLDLEVIMYWAQNFVLMMRSILARSKNELEKSNIKNILTLFRQKVSQLREYLIWYPDDCTGAPFFADWDNAAVFLWCAPRMGQKTEVDKREINFLFMYARGNLDECWYTRNTYINYLWRTFV